MKIAIPTRNSTVDGHFGHCEYYTIFNIDDNNQIAGSQFMASPEGCGCQSNIASLLQNMGVSLLLAGNMGGGALQNLNSFGVEVIRGCSGNVNEVVKEYLAGNITDSGEGCQAHEEHQATGHSCGH